MYAVLKTWLTLKSDRRAVTALEYGLIAALIAGVIIMAVSSLGDNISNLFWSISNQVGNAKNNIQ